MNAVVITIDGPAGAGKTTVSRMLAQALGYRYVDTGALYRAVALAALEAGIEANEDDKLSRLCRKISLEYVISGQGSRLILDGNDITDKIRTPEITMMASAVSARPVVRDFLLGIQKRMGAEKAAVFEGRDMGTVVFPTAEVKFFLDASPKVRAFRRYKELERTCPQSLQEVERDMARRDNNDSSRLVAPLKPATDAILIDSSDISVNEVVDKMLGIVKARLTSLAK